MPLLRWIWVQPGGVLTVAVNAAPWSGDRIKLCILTLYL